MAYDHIYDLQARQSVEGTGGALRLQSLNGILITPKPDGTVIVSIAPSGVTAGTFALAKLTGGGSNGSITIDQTGRVTGIVAPT